MSQPSLNNLDKSNWQTLPFGEIAQSIGERVDPTKTDLETYVGLEHIDPESIHIKRFGKREDVSGTKLRCYPGDVIFGRRRAYQRKAAICEFDGFCSAHSLVLRAIPEVIDPKLFPFFLHSDQFMHRAVDISVGGLSPTINWTKLKQEKFLLPPKDQQAKLAELLWAADAYSIRLEKALYSHTTLYDSRVFELTSHAHNHSKALWHWYVFGELGYSFGGLSGKSKADFGHGAPYVPYLNVFNNAEVDTEQFDLVNVGDNEKQHQLLYGDIMFTGSSETPEEVGMSSVLLKNVDVLYLNSFCFGFRLHNFELLHPCYAKYLLRNPEVRKFMHKHAQGATRFNLSKTTVKSKLKLFLPPVSQQMDLAKELENLEDCILKIEKQVQHTTRLRKSLTNEIFSQPV